MSVTWQIPDKARYIPTDTVYTANFNVPAVGQYSWNTTANERLSILPLQPKTVYLIERVTLAGNIAREDFTASLDPANIPRLRLQKSLDKSAVYTTGIPVLTFVEQQEVALWIYSDRENDSLVGTMRGIINQIPATVGAASISIVVSFGVYAIDANDWQRYFRDRLKPTAGSVLRV